MTGLLAAALLAGCGSSAPAKPVADRVCVGASAAVSRLTGGAAASQIGSRNPVNVTCAISGRNRLRVSVVTQVGGAAYTEFNTETSHQDQVFGSGVHQPGQIPQGITVTGAKVAAWIPAQREVVATDANLDSGGTYLTVTVSGPAVAGAQSLARAVAQAVFAARPGRR